MSARISFMYRRSGGCDRFHTCGECGQLSKNKKDDCACKRHEKETSETAPWKTSYMACKFFQGKGKKKETRTFSEEANGQLNLF